MEERYPGQTVTSSTLPKKGDPGFKYAGQRHPETGVVYDNRGLPNFTDHMTYETRLPARDFFPKARSLQDLAERGKLSKGHSMVRGSEVRSYRRSLIQSAKNKWEITDPNKFKSITNRIKNMDVDHMHELQLNGLDVRGNLSMLDKSVNRSIGAQIQKQLKDLPVGTKITGVTIKNVPK